MGIRNHDKKDPRYSDEKIKITHKGLVKNPKYKATDKGITEEEYNELYEFFHRQVRCR